MQVVDTKLSNKIRNMGFVCSLLVVLIHIWHPQTGSASWWIYELTSFREIAVPYFFVASGYLLAGHVGESDWWHRALRQRVYSLLIPYFIWSVLWVAAVFFCHLLVDWEWSKHLNLTDLFGLNPFRPPAPEHLWYLRSLMFLVVISPVLVKILKWKPFLILGIALVNIFFYRGNAYGTYGYLVDRTMAAGFVFYFLLGLTLRLEVVKITSLPKIKISVAICVAVVLWIASHIIAVSSGRLTSMVLPLTQMTTLLCLYACWLLIPSIEWPQWLTSLAFPIYLSHWTFIQLGVNKIFSNATPISLLMKITVALTGSVVFAMVIKKILNGYSKWFFGGR